MKLSRISRLLLLSAILCLFSLLSASAVLANDLGSSGPPPVAKFAPKLSTQGIAQPSTTVQNPDGSYTFTQVVDENSPAPYYVQPSNGGGFEIYSQFDQDYGWIHDFPDYNASGLVIESAKLKVRAWDVDSEVWHGYDGEYDGLSVDGTMLNPGYLQGEDYSWSETTFDIPVNSITDDGKINCWLDIDMHHDQPTWLTTLDNSELTITYRLDSTGNRAPYQPELSASGTSPVGSNLVVNVLGPTPADPNNNLVHYQYRWFVDVGNGFFVDDEFAGRGDHTGNTVPAADIRLGDKWQVQVTPIDEFGVMGPYTNASWTIVSATGWQLIWLQPLSSTATAEVTANSIIPVKFRWTFNGNNVFDKSVSIRVRNATSNALISGFTYGSFITYDSVTGEYKQDFEPTKYGIQPGTKLKFMVYFGGSLKGTAYANIN